MTTRPREIPKCPCLLEIVRYFFPNENDRRLLNRFKHIATETTLRTWFRMNQDKEIPGLLISNRKAVANLILIETGIAVDEYHLTWDSLDDFKKEYPKNRKEGHVYRSLQERSEQTNIAPKPKPHEPEPLVGHHLRPNVELKDSVIANAVFSAWRDQPRATERLLSPGVYQIFRRYKDTLEHHINDTRKSRDPQEAPVICELAIIDTAAATSVMVTADFNLYSGTFTTSYNGIFSCLLHRLGKSGSHFRYLTLKLWNRDEFKHIPIYSGMMVKTGADSRRPVASELIILKVQHSRYPELVATMNTLLTAANDPQHHLQPYVLNQEAKRALAEYMTAIPPDLGQEQSVDGDHAAIGAAAKAQLERVRYVRNFTLLSELSKDRPSGVMLRDPSRSLSHDDLRHIACNYRLDVFTQSDAVTRDSTLFGVQTNRLDG